MIIEGQHYPDNKARQRLIKEKRKLQTNIHYEYTYKKEINK